MAREKPPDPKPRAKPGPKPSRPPGAFPRLYWATPDEHARLRAILDGMRKKAPGK